MYLYVSEVQSLLWSS